MRVSGGQHGDADMLELASIRGREPGSILKLSRTNVLWECKSVMRIKMPNPMKKSGE